jgi:hypothetical protein
MTKRAIDGNKWNNNGGKKKTRKNKLATVTSTGLTPSGMFVSLAPGRSMPYITWRRMLTRITRATTAASAALNV